MAKQYPRINDIQELDERAMGAKVDVQRETWLGRELGGELQKGIRKRSGTQLQEQLQLAAATNPARATLFMYGCDGHRVSIDRQDVGNLTMHLSAHSAITVQHLVT